MILKRLQPTVTGAGWWRVRLSGKAFFLLVKVLPRTIWGLFGNSSIPPSSDAASYSWLELEEVEVRWGDPRHDRLVSLCRADIVRHCEWWKRGRDDGHRWSPGGLECDLSRALDDWLIYNGCRTDSWIVLDRLWMGFVWRLENRDNYCLRSEKLDCVIKSECHPTIHTNTVFGFVINAWKQLVHGK